MVDLNRRSLFRGRRAPALRPPWARRPDEAFTDVCTRCGDCQRACPEGIVVVADGGFPALDVRQRGCTFCGACVDACKPHALDRRVEPAMAAVAAVGDQCLARRQVDCRVCGDACEARALRFPPRRGGVPVPVLDAAACSGCGACVGDCRVQATGVSPTV